MDALWQADLQNGEYRNPVLFADYSDPDVLRAGERYYLTASSFHYTPGLPILVSDDLVNWELKTYALPNLPHPRYAAPRPSEGVWAPSLRRHDGWFYIFYGTPDEGVYRVRAKDPLGEWEAPVLVLPGKGLIDPCPFWESDGRAYVVHAYARSRIGFKSFLGVFPMDGDATRAMGPDRLLYNGLRTQPTIEGPKVYQKDGWYYLFAPAGGVEHGWQTVLRGRSLLGPFEERNVLCQGQTAVNGPHQGAWVETPTGESWFLHFQSLGAYGRVVHLQPMTWQDGWPVIGDHGEPVARHALPKSRVPSSPRGLRASDDFSGPELSLQWQFSGNHRPEFYSLSQRPGALRLFALPAAPGEENALWHCAHVLTQKLVCPAARFQVELDASGLLPGDRAGLALMGGQYAYLALCREGEGVWRLEYGESRGDERREEALAFVPVNSPKLTLSMRVLPQNGQPSATFFYAVGGGPELPVGPAFLPARHTWVGAKPALFSHAQSAPGGFADFRRFLAMEN